MNPREAPWLRLHRSPPHAPPDAIVLALVALVLFGLVVRLWSP